MMPATSYGTAAKSLHWLIAILLIVQFPLGWLMPDIRRGMTPGTPMMVHVSIGMVVLALIVLRLAWRLTHPVAPEAALPRWQRLSSEALHWLLYALVLVTALSGWFYVSMRGWAIDLFGLLRLPGLVAEGSQLGRALGRLHESLTVVLVVFVGLHVAAAFVHLFVYRDRIMQRMLPRLLQRERSEAEI
jgi:cytochrome b561